VGFCHDGLTSPEDDEQTNEAMPSLLTLIAATKSAFSEKPHSTQTKSACVLRLSLDTCSQHRQKRLVFGGGTGISNPPRHTVLHSNWRRNSYGLASKIERLSPDFARRFFPGLAFVPAADADMFLTCKSSTQTIAWFLLMLLEALCTKSFLMLAILLLSEPYIPALKDGALRLDCGKKDGIDTLSLLKKARV
jgi:hypothetical protein